MTPSDIESVYRGYLERNLYEKTVSLDPWKEYLTTLVTREGDLSLKIDISDSFTTFTVI